MAVINLNYSGFMDLLLKILKISGLLILILVLAVLFAPTLKGPFVIIHFSTALRGWLLAQVVLIGFAVAARALYARLLAPVSASRNLILPIHCIMAPAFGPMRC